MAYGSSCRSFIVIGKTTPRGGIIKNIPLQAWGNRRKGECVWKAHDGQKPLFLEKIFNSASEDL